MPTLLAVGVVVFLIAADAPWRSPSWSTIRIAIESIGIAGAVAIFAVSVAVAVSLQPLQFRLVQLLEGYWPLWVPRFVVLFGIRCEMHRRGRLVDRQDIDSLGNSSAARIAALERAQAAGDQLNQRFPPREDRLLPTALGNALRASEDRVGKRYDLDSVTIWTRLFPLLPERFRAGFDDEVTQLDVSVRLSVTWAVAGTLGLLWLLRDLTALIAHPLWMAVPASLYVLARLSYQSAVESAIAQGVDLEVAVDLYRARVIDAMRLNPTNSLDQERRVFRELCVLFQTSGISTQNLHFRSTARAGGPDE